LTPQPRGWTFITSAISRRGTLDENDVLLMNVQAPAFRNASDHRFFLAAAVGIASIVFVGFARSYFLKSLDPLRQVAGDLTVPTILTGEKWQNGPAVILARAAGRLVGAGLFRISFERVPALTFLKTGGPFGLFGLDLLLVDACGANDTWRHRRLHPALVCGALLIAFEDLPFLGMFLSSHIWTHFATSLVS
jgi:hypothetical protein